MTDEQLDLAPEDARIDAILRSMTEADLALPEPPASLWDDIEAAVNVATAPTAERTGVVVDLSARFRRSPARYAAAAAAVALIAGAVAFTAGDRTTSEVVGEAQLVWDTAFVSEGTDVVVDADLVATGESRSITIADAALPTRSDEDLELWLIGVDAAGELTIQTLGIIDDAAAPGSYDIPADFDLDGFDQVLVDISFEPRDGVEAHSGASIVRGPVSDV